MRLLWFTDTLADVNGVSRFIRDIARIAHARGDDVTVVTSTRLPMPEMPNAVNIQPRLASRMPGYSHLEIVWPRWREFTRFAESYRPDVIHVSTPGPVGLAGVLAARKLRVPLVGTYHTDFPAYIDHLLNDAALSWMCLQTMRAFYSRFARVLTRSGSYIDSVKRLGVIESKITPLTPGIDISRFNTSFRDETVWRTLASREGGGHQGIDRPSVKVVYAGRVSVEKNLPMLTKAWMPALRECEARGFKVDLVVAGDGPYRTEMERTIGRHNAHFLGFVHGTELSTVYATSDLFVFPSTTDTLGQAVMEAQASGLPALVSDIGGPREIIRHNQTGLVIPANEGRAWTSAIVDLIADTERRQSMSRAAADHLRHSDIAHSFNHFRELHEQALRDHAARQ